MKKVIEKGHLFFFYKPKIDIPNPKNWNDIAKLHILMVPIQESQDHKCRIISIPKKKLPSIDKHDINLCFVDEVSDSIDTLRKDVLDPVHYQTPKSHRDRITQGDRVLGEAIYMIEFGEQKSHLSYVLEVPKYPLEIQQIFNIEKEGSFVIQVKNPKFPYMGRFSMVNYPKEITDLFADLKYIPLQTIKLLNYDKAEFLMIGGRHHIVDEIHEYGEELEEEAEYESKKLNPKTVYTQVHLKKDENHPADPIIKGKFA